MNAHPSPLNRGYLAALIIVLIGAIQLLLLGIFNKNLVQRGLNYIVNYDTSIMIVRILYVVVGLAALYILFLTKSRPFLTFLDTTVMPPSLLLVSEQEHTNQTLSINAEGAVKVMYWAAHADKQQIESTPQQGYGEFENIGIAAVKEGKAIFKLNCPTQYKVGKKILPKHVHYRLVYENGVVSDVKTLNLNC